MTLIYYAQKRGLSLDLRPLRGGAVRFMGGLRYHKEFREYDKNLSLISRAVKEKKSVKMGLLGKKASLGL